MGKSWGRAGGVIGVWHGLECRDEVYAVGLFGRPEEGCQTRMNERLRGGMVDTRSILVRSVLPRSWREKVTGSRGGMVTGEARM